MKKLTTGMLPKLEIPVEVVFNSAPYDWAGTPKQSSVMQFRIGGADIHHGEEKVGEVSSGLDGSMIFSTQGLTLTIRVQPAWEALFSQLQDEEVIARLKQEWAALQQSLQDEEVSQ